MIIWPIDFVYKNSTNETNGAHSQSQLEAVHGVALVVHMKNDRSSCGKIKKQDFFSTVMKEILSEFGLQGVSHRSAAAVHACVSVSSLCVCVQFQTHVMLH